MTILEKIKILYIDDEANNLFSFKAMFRHDYEVLTAASAEEGLQRVSENPDIKIIFCDQRMPEKTGVEFFEEISKTYPNPVRMLITGYIDIESVIKAINKGHIYRYLTKPWREEDVRSAIEEGFKYYTTSSLLSIKNKELQEANAELDKFTYSVTHDIRGPVVSIIGAIQLIKNLDDIQEIKSIVSMMEQSAEKVKDLISNIHSYYNLKRGNLNIQEIDFTQLLNELLALHQVEASLNKIQILSEVDQKEVFRSDMTVLQLILNNILSNALKYQRIEEKNKYVRVKVSVERGVANIDFSDNGIGIDDQYIDEIFNMFFRATKENVGSGFGLYNVKDALNKLDGTIKVESKLGEGTCFFIQIPTK